MVLCMVPRHHYWKAWFYKARILLISSLGCKRRNDRPHNVQILVSIKHSSIQRTLTNYIPLCAVRKSTYNSTDCMLYPPLNGAVNILISLLWVKLVSIHQWIHFTWKILVNLNHKLKFRFQIYSRVFFSCGVNQGWQTCGCKFIYIKRS